MAAPMPRLAPVTSTTLSLNCMRVFSRSAGTARQVCCHMSGEVQGPRNETQAMIGIGGRLQRYQVERPQPVCPRVGRDAGTISQANDLKIDVAILPVDGPTHGQLGR